MKSAAIQMSSTNDVTHNLQRASELVLQAKIEGAKFVLLPEYFYFMGGNDADRIALAEVYRDGSIQRYVSQIARDNNVWLMAGTIPITSDDPKRFFNSQLLFNPQGECVGRYDKVHLFGFDNGRESYCEADTMCAGNNVETMEVADFKVRASTCYDLRFPELYRHDVGYHMITAPAAFTYTTGKAHWELLLRNRAVENQCYVIASAQVGEHSSSSTTYGHSMIVDPWGEVIDILAEGEGVVIADLDMEYIHQIRNQLPALKNRQL